MRLELVLPLFLVLSILSISVASAESIKWHFTDSDAGNNLNGKLMTVNQGSGGTIVLHKGESAWWFSEPAKDDKVYYGKWKVVYHAETNSESSHRIYVRLYKVKAGVPYLISEKYNKLKKSNGLTMKNRDLGEYYIPLNQSERIAVEIQWSNSAESGENLTLYFNQNYESYLQLDLESPNPPVPELSTAALVICGILVLVLLITF
ncbi:MAG: hypothetical protein H0Z28_09570 [Archaeoglobus sp.]|nr:hypothetical protein [Archaeoglobus sp.]